MEQQIDDRVYTIGYEYDGMYRVDEVLAYDYDIAQKKIANFLDVEDMSEIHFSPYNPIDFCSFDEWLKDHTNVIV